ncbi:MAG: glycosyltransferase [Sphingobacteriales bacterium]|nr:glycosyltransferase [Sphingobacteriales bacterium]
MVLLVVLSLNRTANPLTLSSPKSVSVVICAKNEAENLRKNLPLILQQKYPDYEVIVVDDGSDDTTAQLGIKDVRLKLIHLTKEEKVGLGKKYALQKGVEQAKNEVVLLTDADCRPLSESWISEMAARVDEQHKIVLGISPYKKKRGFLNGLTEYETAQTALQYLGWALLGNPYMSVGRNVAYDAVLIKKKIWTEKELSIASGDDDLTIQTMANARNTTVCLSLNSYTVSDAEDNWPDWMKQKIRHYQSGALYKPFDRMLLGAYWFTKMGVYCLLVFSVIALLFIENETIITGYAFLIFAVYFSMTILYNFFLNRRLHLNSRWYLAGIYDCIYSVTVTSLGLISRISPTSKW